MFYPVSGITAALKQFIRDKNVVKTYFKDGNLECDQHAGTCNLEVLNATVYKQYVCTTAKVLNKYITFRPHPRNLDGTSPPSEEVLKEFGFLDVNNAIVGAMAAIANQTTTQQPHSISLEEVNVIVKENASQIRNEMSQGMENLCIEIIADAHTYTNIITQDLHQSLDARFAAIMNCVNDARMILNGSMPIRKALPGAENKEGPKTP